MWTKITLLAFLALALFLPGCMTVDCKPQGAPLAADAVPAITAAHAVAIVNATPDADKILFLHYMTWTCNVKLHDVAETAAVTTRQTLPLLHVKVDDAAEKKLVLSVPQAHGEAGVWMFTSYVTLKVRLGSGLEKEFQGYQNFPSLYGVTPSIEWATMDCVKQMLEDKDIRDYLGP